MEGKLQQFHQESRPDKVYWNKPTNRNVNSPTTMRHPDDYARDTGNRSTAVHNHIVNQHASRRKKTKHRDCYQTTRNMDMKARPKRLYAIKQ